MLFVWLGVFALFIGPLLVSTLGRFQAASRVLDSFVVVAIGGLVFLHILPESLAEAGWPALAAVLLGATIPTLLHSPLHALSAPCHSRGTTGLLLLSALAMSLHAVFDGVALAPSALAADWPGHLWSEHSHIALAVVLHRLLEGTGLWYLMRPALGRVGALVAMGFLAAATWLGFVGAGWVVASGGEAAMAFVQAAVAGSLLHVLAHHAPGSQTPTRRWAWESGVGLGLGAGLLALLASLEQHAHHGHEHGGHHHLSLWGTTAQLSLSMAPWVLVSLVLTALLHALLPSGLPHLPARAVGGAWPRLHKTLAGAARGLLTDTAFARVAGLYAHAEVDAQHSQTSQPQTTAFLLMAPAFGVTAAMMSLAGLGLSVTLYRIGALIAWATVASFGLGAPKQAHHVHQGTHVCTQARPVRATRLGDGLHFAFGEGVDALAPWLLLGLMLAALMQQTLSTLELATWTQARLDVPLVGVLAAPVYLSPVLATLIGLILWHKGLSLGALVTYTLCSSAISVVSLRQLARLHGGIKAWASMLGLYGLSVAIGYGINLSTMQQTLPQLSPAPSLISGAASVVVAGLIALSCLRQGVRAFLAPITAWSMHLGHHHHH